MDFTICDSEATEFLKLKLKQTSTINIDINQTNNERNNVSNISTRQQQHAQYPLYPPYHHQFHGIPLDLNFMKHNFDPLNDSYNNLKQSQLVIDLNVPNGIIKEIISYTSYIESTIQNEPLSNVITSTPSNHSNECALLITTPSSTSNINIEYMLKSIKFRCGYFPNQYGEYPVRSDATIMIQIELFNGTNHHKHKKHDNNNTDNIIWKSDTMKAGNSVEIIHLDDINVKLKSNKHYLFWIQVIEGQFHGRYCKHKFDGRSSSTVNDHENKQQKLIMVTDVNLRNGNYGYRWYWKKDDMKIWEMQFSCC